MHFLRPGLIVGGGLMMIAGFFLPWGQATFMGMHAPVFGGLELAQRESVWYLLPLFGGIMTVLGLVSLLLQWLGRTIAIRYLGSASILFSLLPAVTLVRVIVSLHTGGVSFGWMEGVTAESLDFSYKIGLPLELAGCVMAAVAGTWMAYADRYQRPD